MVKKVHTIDAEGRAPGRVATEAAVFLMGKHKASYTPHILDGDAVEIINAAKIKTFAKKLEGKIYYRHTNYPGGLKKRTMKEVMADDPTKVLRMAVEKMLPKNKLRPRMLKNLKISA